MSNNKSKQTSTLEQLYQLFPGLVENIEHTYPKHPNPNLPPPKISIVLDGGGFSGTHIVGALAYIQFLQNQKRLHVQRIAGVSVGAICALLFAINRLDLAFDLYPQTRTHFEKYNDLSIVSKQLQHIQKIIPKDFHKKSKLSISFFDTKKMKHKTINHFTSNQHIIEIIRRSIHIPWVYDKTILYRDRFIDGLYPTTFITHPINKCPTIFLNLFNMPWNNMLHVSNRPSTNDTALEGALLVHRFIRTGKDNHFCHQFKPFSYHGAIFLIRITITHIIIKLLLWIYKENGPWAKYAKKNIIKHKNTILRHFKTII